MSLIDEVIIHYSGNAADSTPETVDTYHRGLGWPGEAYTWHVMQDGRAIQTQPYTVAGFQCGSGSPPIPWANLNGEERRYVHSGVGWNNWHTLGVLMVGLTPTAAQLSTVWWLIHQKIPARLKKFLPPIPHTVISMGTTPCPGVTYKDWWPKIL